MGRRPEPGRQVRDLKTRRMLKEKKVLGENGQGWRIKKQVS